MSKRLNLQYMYMYVYLDMFWNILELHLNLLEYTGVTLEFTGIYWSYTRVYCVFQVNDSQAASSPPGLPGSPGEALSKRCVSLVKTALKPDIWPNIDIRIPWFAKLLEAMVSSN